MVSRGQEHLETGDVLKSNYVHGHEKTNQLILVLPNIRVTERPKEKHKPQK